MKARVRSITFDHHERPKRAVILTTHGIVHVEWMNVAGEWCWFTSGSGEAKRAAVPAIERISQWLGQNFQP